MIEEGIITHFLSKINSLERKAKKANFSSDDYKKEIEKLKNWLISSRRLKCHRTFFAFVTYLFHSEHGKNYENCYLFYDDLMKAIGHIKINTKKNIIKDGTCPNCNYPIPEIIQERNDIERKSLSFEKCNQKTFMEVFEKVKDFSIKNFKINFDDWFETFEVGERE